MKSWIIKMRRPLILGGVMGLIGAGLSLLLRATGAG
jgi:hypothetical protein